MTKILCNDRMGKQMIFGSFNECAAYFGINTVRIKKSIDSGNSLNTDKGSWFFDYLEDGEK